MPELAFLNGEFTSIDEAKVSIDDRGFQFGDGVYEVVRSYDGRLWALERHLVRLRNSLEAIGIRGLAIEEVREKVEEANRRAGLAEALVYFQITRGIASRMHTYSEDLNPTFLITVRRHPDNHVSLSADRVSVITLSECRWQRRDIKSTNLLPNVLAKQRAHKFGAYEAVFVEDGRVNEGAATNVFVVRQGDLYTAPLGTHLLHGITRQLVLETAAGNGIASHEEFFSLEQLRNADEVFLTGTSIEALPVTRVDDIPIADASIGPTTAKLQRLYRERVQRKDDAIR